MVQRESFARSLARLKMRVTVIGAEGFVGSAFVRLLKTRRDVELVSVTRRNFDQFAGQKSDVVIEAACNSKKYLADADPLADFEASVTHRLKTLLKYPADLHVHISSVDVYSDLTSPATTREDSPIDLARVSRYGMHKLMAENLVQHYAAKWLILRLAGMVGPGLHKNPVYDILHDQPLRVHPDSRFQYMNTDEVARIGWALVEQAVVGEIINVCGDGTITMREIARLAGKNLNLSPSSPSAAPRIVEANNEKVKRFAAVPSVVETIIQFCSKITKPLTL
jgi:nucleoside-diphosphate-sugar epimerase